MDAHGNHHGVCVFVFWQLPVMRIDLKLLAVVKAQLLT
jgi:hypothetical protein